ncbi:hypothetical protein LINGRAHAP2_LOCUS17081 [Linum grandiflorum]
MVGHNNNTAEEPEAAEFISALAAGNNSQLMVIAASSSSSATTSTVLALVAAAHQTGGRVVCIHGSEEETEIAKRTLGPFWQSRSEVLGFVTGEAHEILGSAQYEGADFVVIDCNLEGHDEEVLAAARKRNGAVVVGYNADFSRVGSWWRTNGWRTQLLPIGDRGGLLVTRVAPPVAARKSGSRWVVKVDQCTGEEHVFRVR